MLPVKYHLDDMVSARCSIIEISVKFSTCFWKDRIIKWYFQSIETCVPIEAQLLLDGDSTNAIHSGTNNSWTVRFESLTDSVWRRNSSYSCKRKKCFRLFCGTPMARTSWLVSLIQMISIRHFSYGFKQNGSILIVCIGPVRRLYCRHAELQFETPEEELKYFLKRTQNSRWKWKGRTIVSPEHAVLCK